MFLSRCCMLRQKPFIRANRIRWLSFFSVFASGGTIYIYIWHANLPSILSAFPPLSHGSPLLPSIALFPLRDRRRFEASEEPQEAVWGPLSDVFIHVYLFLSLVEPKTEKGGDSANKMQHPHRSRNLHGARRPGGQHHRKVVRGLAAASKYCSSVF